MQHTQELHRHGTLEAPLRNRYFYGKLLDVHHFEMEQDYLNGKRWMLNRLLFGYGVICGLDVRYEGGDQVTVGPGVALDRCGREIVVPRRSREVRLPRRRTEHIDSPGQEKQCDDGVIFLCICYHECDIDPVPTMAENCEVEDHCASGAVREHYRLVFRDDIDEDKHRGSYLDLSGERTTHNSLAHLITHGCPDMPSDCCIPLARIPLNLDHQNDIEIAIRPIVYSNHMLQQLIRPSRSDRSKRHDDRQAY